MLRARGLWKDPVVEETPAVETTEVRAEAGTTPRPMPRPTFDGKGQKPTLTPTMPKKAPVKADDQK